MSSVSVVCICGKKRGTLNDTNWARHTTSCKTVITVKTNENISKFFKRPAPNSTELSELVVKKTRSGKYINYKL